MDSVASAELKRIEDMVCLARGMSASTNVGNVLALAGQDMGTAAQRYLAEHEATFHAATSGLLGSEELRKYLQQISWIDNLSLSNESEKFLQAVDGRLYPWISDLDREGSIRGFFELHALGSALDLYHPYDQEITDATRGILGDWTNLSSLPPEIYTDPLARSAFYIERGYDTAIANYPGNAFAENLRFAGLYVPAAEHDETPIEDEGKQRTLEAQKLLFEFECELRRFIDSKMAQCAGPNWPKHRVDKKVFDGWKEKQQKDEQSRRVKLPIVDFIDFSEYEAILTRADSWKDVFGAYFLRVESVRESFCRLRPLRNAADHARTLTQDDFVYLTVELKRLRQAMSEPPTKP